MASGVELATAYISLAISSNAIAPQVRRELGQVDKDADRVGKAAGKKLSSGLSAGIKGAAAGFAAAFTVDKVVGGFKDVIGKASELEQSMGGVGAVFGRSAGEIETASKAAATQLGLSRNAYNELATTVGAGLKNKGIKDFADQSQNLIGIGADLAAQFGGSTKDAVEAIASAMRGESDPIERYGVALNETAVAAQAAAMGMQKSKGGYTEQQKTMARLALITKQTADAQGAFARESDTAAGKQARLSASLDNVKTTVGSKLLPFVSKAAGALSDFVSGMDTGTGAGGKFAEVMRTVASVGGTVLGFLSRHRDILIPLVASLGTILGLYKAWTLITRAATAAQAAFNLVMSANPIGIVVLAVAGLVAALVVLYQRNETVRKFMQAAWAGIKAVIGGVVSWFTGTAWPVISAVFGWIGGKAIWLWSNVIKPYFTLVWGLLKSVFGWLKNTAWPIVADVFGWVADKAKWLWEKGVKPYFDLLKRGVEAVTSAFSSAKEMIGKIWSGLVGGISGPISTALGWIKDKFVGPLASLLDKIGLDSLASSLRGAIPSMSSGGSTGGRSTRGGTMKGYAGGGLIRGPWRGERADNVLGVTDQGMPIARVNPREYILPVRATDRLRQAVGAGGLEMLRRGILPRLAIGGDVVGLNADFLKRLSAWNAALGNAYRVSSGYRSIAEQTALWNRSDKSGRMVARPGSSMHNFGLAADLAPATTAQARAMASMFGLYFPMSYEPWHIQPVGAKRGGGVLGWIGDLFSKGAGAVLKPIESVIDKIPGTTIIADMGKALLRKAFDAVKAKVENFIGGLMPGGGDSGGAVGAGVGQWRGVVGTALRMLGQPGSLADTVLRRMMQESGGNPRAINNWDVNAQRGDPSRGLMQVIGCVPMSTRILTRRGWLSHDEVVVGDETIGFNHETGRSEWTRVTGVVRYENAEVWRIGNRQWSAEVTPEHRWVTEVDRDMVDAAVVCPTCGPGWPPRRGMETHLGKAHGIRQARWRVVDSGFSRTSEMRREYLRVAAVADTPTTLPITDAEAAIIGWLHGDGVLRQDDATGRWDGALYQSKPAGVESIRGLLAEVPHAESLRKPRPSDSWPALVWRLRRAWMTDLVRRARLDALSPEEFVALLSTSQRCAWLGAMVEAEGHACDGFISIAQVDGPMQDAITLAVYLEGHRPTFSAMPAAARGFQPSGHVGMARPRVAASMLAEPEVLERQPVWCVETDLGSWTMRQGRRVSLTGNSTFRAYAMPGYASDIYDPLSNILASMRYALARYGSLSAAYNRAGGYAGGGEVIPFVADAGVTLAPGLNLLNNKLGKPEPLARTDQIDDRSIEEAVRAGIIEGMRMVRFELDKRQVGRATVDYAASLRR